MQFSKYHFHILGTVLGLLWTVGATPAHAQKDFKSATDTANQHITTPQLRDYLTFIASDELEGRNTPSRGLDIAAKFIAVHMSRWGLKPAGDNGTYFQTMMLTQRSVDVAKSKATLNGTTLQPGKDFVPFRTGGSGEASGQVVYGGHGYFAKNLNLDAYKGVDVKGKIVVLHGRLPRNINFRAISQSGEMGKDWMIPTDYAKQAGAVGIVYIPSSDSPDEWEGLVNNMSSGGRGFTPDFGQNDTPLPAIYLAPDKFKALFAGEKVNTDAIYQDRNQAQANPAFELATSKTLTFTPAVLVDKVPTQNVVAVWEGSDPKLKGEYVALGAHYDHVGVNERATGDKIFNGADDDGSGTVALMGIAEALAKSPNRPKRSVLFVWHAGEEKGLWGSEYFVEKPTVPLNAITAQINIDMIGRSKVAGDQNPRNRELSGPNTIYVIGATLMSSQLEALTKEVNANYLKLEYDYRYDAPSDPNRFFYRSDHYNYAKKGIPVLFYFDGVHEDYHRPGDHVEKIDFDKLTKVTRTIFATVVEIANRPERLVVDKKLER